MTIAFRFNRRQVQVYDRAMSEMRRQLEGEASSEFVMECILADFLASRKNLKPPFPISTKDLKGKQKPPLLISGGHIDGKLRDG